MSFWWDRIVRRSGALGVGLLLAVVAVACGKTADSSGGSGRGTTGTGGQGATTRCDPPLMDCKNDCVNIERDAANCGACGARCPGGAPCLEGVCAGTSCPGGQVNCGGLCVDTNADSLNCGACNVACDTGMVCRDAVCSCGDVHCNGVCTSLNTNADCGGCGIACADTELCVNQQCTPMCKPPYTNCDGVCRDLSVDAKACGQCGIACSAAEACTDGTCSCPKAATRAVCNGACADLSSDGTNCGKCGNACTANNVCNNGQCSPCPDNSFFFCPSPAGDPLAECRAQAAALTASMSAGDAPNGKAPPDPTCQCNKCFEQLDDCRKDSGCVSAWQCAVAKGCTDASCWDTMGACMVSTGPAGGCWKFCPPSTGSTASVTLAQALLTCSHESGCGI